MGNRPGILFDLMENKDYTGLRLALAEMLYGDEKKVGVVINEAVELTKKYGADEDYQFVNGLLGTVAREQGLDTAEDAASEEP